MPGSTGAMECWSNGVGGIVAVFIWLAVSIPDIYECTGVRSRNIQHPETSIQ
jgi:hypothetical protein